MHNLLRFLAAFAAVFSRSLVSSTAFDLHEVSIPTVNSIEGASAILEVRRGGNPLLHISIQNNFSAPLKAYVTGFDVDTGDALILQNINGSNFQWFRPNAGGSDAPVDIVERNFALAINLPKNNVVTNFTLPSYINSGRIWLSAGDLVFRTVHNASSKTGQSSLVEPSGVDRTLPPYNRKWGFIEFTNTNAGGIWVNLSFVDWVGLVIGMALTSENGRQVVAGLQPNATEAVCNDMEQLGDPWADMCIRDTNNDVLRILSPNMYLSQPGNANKMDKYYTDYVDAVWKTYSNTTLTIATQDSGGLKNMTGGRMVNCTVKGGFENGKLLCPDDSAHTYAKPNTNDIMGCNTGPFAVQDFHDIIHKEIVARLCAAFVRTTLLLPGGNVQPSLAVGNSTYYTAKKPEDPTNHYARIVHKYLKNNEGYAFSYDDVNPGEENAAGVLTAAHPTRLEIFVQN